MSLKLLLCFISLSVCVRDVKSSYMGNEKSLRKHLADLLEHKLAFSDDKLPFEKDELPDHTPKNQSEYDFIVIGAGSAGAAVASRLSEIKNVKVLLIEAGGKEYSIIDVPSLAEVLSTTNEIIWNYKTESSDKYCLANEDGKCSFPRGKVMGGSSCINGMLAMRGHPRDYDEWVSETGDDSWSYRNMMKYFEKLEDFDGNRKVENQRGPVHITEVNRRPKISKSFIEAAKEMGFSEFKYDGPDQVGFTYFHTTTFAGERWSTNRAYLRPIRHRKNLILTQRSIVHKVLIDKITKTAYGVRYSKNNKIYEVRAKKEIILSAGSINSPQILMLSGVGPRKDLQKLDIDVIKDSPVGKNFIDHLLYRRYLTFLVNDSSAVVIPNVLDSEDPSIRNYLRDRSGILSYGTRMNALAIFNIDNQTDLNPNLEIIFSAGNTMVTNESITSKAQQSYGFLVLLMRPLSRGKISLRSNNPLDKPKIYPNYLEHPEDVERLTKGIRMALTIGETEALKRHGSEFQQFSSTCDIHEKGSDEYWECELRMQSSPGLHPVGTCRMGRKNSSDAVVDSQLKVIGVKGLRVADASVMLNIVAAHTNIPTIAIGEKAADLIKMHHGYYLKKRICVETFFSFAKFANYFLSIKKCSKK